MNITLTLSERVAEQVEVFWKTDDGTAIADVDYIPSSGHVVFEPGETSKVINVVTIPRQTSNKRAFYIILDNAVNAEISDGTAVCNIVPLVVNGPLVKSSLITNAYNNQLGRGGVFPF